MVPTVPTLRRFHPSVCTYRCTSCYSAVVVRLPISALNPPWHLAPSVPPRLQNVRATTESLIALQGNVEQFIAVKLKERSSATPVATPYLSEFLARQLPEVAAGEVTPSGHLRSPVQPAARSAGRWFKTIPWLPFNSNNPASFQLSGESREPTSTK